MRNLGPWLVTAAILVPLPALAIEITPTGVMFTDYSYNILPTAGFQAFNVSRARLGANVKLTDAVNGKVQYDVGATGVFLTHAYGEALTNLGTFRMGRFSTAWTIPTAQTYWPYRFMGENFSTVELGIPTEDLGLAWTGDMGKVKATLGIFNGEGGPEATGPKSYEALLRFRPGNTDDMDFGVYGRHNATINSSAYSDQGLVGAHIIAGPAHLGLEGAINYSVGGASPTGTVPAVATSVTSTSYGGSGFVYLPDIAMEMTPALRIDYFDPNNAPAGSPSSAHIRTTIGLIHDWAPGVSTSLDDTHTMFMDGKTSAVNVVAMHGKVSF